MNWLVSLNILLEINYLELAFSIACMVKFIRWNAKFILPLYWIHPESNQICLQMFYLFLYAPHILSSANESFVLNVSFTRFNEECINNTMQLQWERIVLTTTAIYEFYVMMWYF